MENNLPFMSVACIIGLGYIKLPHSGSVFIPVRPPCSCLVFVNMEGITNHWQEAVSPMINVLFSGSWITHLVSLLHWSPGGRIIKDLFWINNMEQQHHTVCPNFSWKKKIRLQYRRRASDVLPSLTWKKRRASWNDGGAPSVSQETPPRKPFSFCSLLPQQFAAAAPTLNSFARTQSSVTLLTEGKRDITLID